MTDPTIPIGHRDGVALMEYLRNVGLQPDEGFLQEGLRQLTQTVLELEAAEQIGAGRYERTPERKTYRNGHRERVWETRVGEIPLRIPKVRDGSYFPSLLEPRRRSEKALLAVVQQAYVEGVSTRRVDDLMHIVPMSLREALGLTGIDTPALPKDIGTMWRAVPGRAGFPASARSWTRWWSRSGTARWRANTPSSGWTRCISRCVRTIGLSARRW